MGGWEGGGGGSSLLESLNISPCSTVAIVLTTTCDKQSYYEVYFTGCSAYKADVRSPEQDSMVWARTRCLQEPSSRSVQRSVLSL